MTSVTRKLLQSDEGKLFLSGLSLDIALLIVIFVLSLLGSPWTIKVLSMLGTHLISGRAGGISIGMEMGFPNWFIIIFSTMLDSQIVLFLFPLFVFSYNNVVEIKFLKGMIDSSREAAEKQKETISRFGIFGLLLFVWFPLHMTGPLVGAIIGHFIGLKPFKNISIVLSGTFLAVISWVLFFRKAISISGEYSFLIPITVVLLAIIGFFVLRWRHKKEIKNLKK